MDTLAMIRQAFTEESMSCTWVFEWHAQFKTGPKKVKRKVKNMLIIFFFIRELVHKEFVLACQTVNSICQGGVS
jgi:hypothetical protein